MEHVGYIKCPKCGEKASLFRTAYPELHGDANIDVTTGAIKCPVCKLIVSDNYKKICRNNICELFK